MYSHKELVYFLISVIFNSVIQSETVTEPDFCKQNVLDSVFSDYKNKIYFANDEWIWTSNDSLKTVSTPNRIDPNQKFQIKSVAHISAIPLCDSDNSSTNCASIQWAKDLVIMTYMVRKKSFAGAYQLKRVVDGVLTKLNDKTNLPFGLKANGNIFSNDEFFWPKKLTENLVDSNRSHTIVVYNPISYELIVLANGRNEGWICFNAFHTLTNWSDSWKCESTQNDWQFIGAFLKNRNIYVMAIKGNANRLFTLIKGPQLLDTSINVQQYFQCSLQTNDMAIKIRSKANKKSSNKTLNRFSDESLINSSDESLNNSSDESSTSWIIIGIAIVLFIIVIIGSIAFFATRKTKQKQNPTVQTSVPDSINSESEPIYDTKGRPVTKSRIGALDSKVSWDIIVSKSSINTLNNSPDPGLESKNAAQKEPPLSPILADFKNKEKKTIRK